MRKPSKKFQRDMEIAYRKFYAGELDMLEFFNALKDSKHAKWSVPAYMAEGLEAVKTEHFTATFEVEQNTISQIYRMLGINEPSTEE